MMTPREKIAFGFLFVAGVVPFWVPAVCTNLLLVVLDLISLAAGVAGALLVAYAIGDPPDSAHTMTTPTGIYKGAYLLSKSHLRRGIRLIIVAGVLQAPKLVCGLRSASISSDRLGWWALLLWVFLVRPSEWVSSDHF